MLETDEEMARFSFLASNLEKIPNTFRDFTLSIHDLMSEFQIQPKDASDLIAAGMPISNTQSPRFDVHDVVNVVLHLGLRAAPTLAMRFWARAYNRTLQGDRAGATVTFEADCPYLRHESDCNLEVNTGTSLICSSTGKIRHVETYDCPTSWPSLTQDLRSFLDYTSDFTFFSLPSALHEDTLFAKESRLANCKNFSKYLPELASQMGVEARPAFGLLLATPFSTSHSWVEILLENRWVPIDPLFISFLCQLGFLNSHDWPIHRSPGHALFRFQRQHVPLCQHQGDPISVSLRTAYKKNYTVP